MCAYVCVCITHARTQTHTHTHTHTHCISGLGLGFGSKVPPPPCQETGADINQTKHDNNTNHTVNLETDRVDFIKGFLALGLGSGCKLRVWVGIGFWEA